MSIFDLFRRQDPPIDINTEAHRHTMIAITAHHHAVEADAHGSVAARHLHDVAMRHALIGQGLDGILEAYESRSQEESNR